MKKLSLLFLLAFAINSVAQDKPLQVHYFPVFPGCENLDTQDRSLFSCFATQLNQKLAVKLDSFVDWFQSQGYTNASVKINFIVAKNGKLISPKLKDETEQSEANVQLGEAVVGKFLEIANELEGIIPGKLEDGTPVNLSMDLPVTIKINNVVDDFSKGKELVILTLFHENSRYEIRTHSKNENHYLVYETTNGTNIYLGRFSTIGEIFQLEPYHTAIQNLDSKILVGEKEVQGILHKIYYTSPNLDTVEVYYYPNGKEILRERTHVDNLNYSKLYLEILSRS